ncbi:hemolysin family protein [Rhodovulum sp. DZ06]|uniref:hemolysin family protein n=1 Tax=Rhodovulum sp. DZ06 TaxID=3425126 RepID=UPI003D337FAB
MESVGENGGGAPGGASAAEPGQSSGAGPAPAAQAQTAAMRAAPEGGGHRGSLFGRLFGFGPHPAAPPEEPGAPDPEQAAAEQAAGEREMLVNVRKLRDKRVYDIMVPRGDIAAVEIEEPLEAVLDVFRDTRHTRLPVYVDTLDDPQGFVHLKDVALHHGFGEGNGEFDLRRFLRPVLYAPPSMPIGALLQKMQRQRVHMALVIDEYGGVDGLLTIEDLIEQIVGEIEDEHDVADEARFRELAPGVFAADARVELEDFEEAAGVDLLPDGQHEELDTLGGLVFVMAGRVPGRGEVIQHADGHEFEVIDADPRRIKRLRVRLAGASAIPRAAE